MPPNLFEERFKRVYAKRSDDEINVLKTQAIALPDHRAMLVMVVNKTGKLNECPGFVRYLTRVGTVDNWMNLAERISSKNPAEPLRTPMLEMDGGDFCIYLNKTHATRLYFKRFLLTKFKKAMQLEDFLEKNRLERELEILYPYPLEIEGMKIEDYTKFEEGKWYSKTVETFAKDRVISLPRVIM